MPHFGTDLLESRLKTAEIGVNVDEVFAGTARQNFDGRFAALQHFFALGPNEPHADFTGRNRRRLRLSPPIAIDHDGNPNFDIVLRANFGHLVFDLVDHVPQAVLEAVDILFHRVGGIEHERQLNVFLQPAKFPDRLLNQALRARRGGSRKRPDLLSPRLQCAAQRVADGCLNRGLFRFVLFGRPGCRCPTDHPRQTSGQPQHG